MKFDLIGNPEKYNIATVAAELIALAKQKGAEVIADEDLGGIVGRKCKTASPKKLASACDVAITLGGDGTVMKAAHRVGFLGLPILGINLGTLGFLAEVPLEEMGAAITELLNGKVDREERSLISATTSGKKKFSVDALNEIVIDRRAGTRMIQLEMFVDGKFLNTYVADGIIIATPTGSTAYSLSAGGPIVSPASRVFIITPLAPHTLTARPFVVPDTVEIRIAARSDSQPMALFADGQEGCTLSSPATIVLRRSKKTVTFIRRKNISSYDILRAKLLWGKDVRAEISKTLFRKK
ncbi:MAG TPA: NAD(+)/NADH kinase [Candidatus Kapabacteria bacterium]|nr:NAD(+)/NADH kinase [Candidatus Kapabacteria bacterium]